MDIKQNLNVILDPKKREKYVKDLLNIEGLRGIVEDPHSAYCPISLTSTPDELKALISRRQEILIDGVLKPAGITTYDPESAPYSPEVNLTSQPEEVYLVDSVKTASSRFFVGHNILPSSGVAIESEKAKTFNKICVMLMDKNIRVSRMQPHRGIYLEYSNFEKEYTNFIPIFKLLKEYSPGVGFNRGIPALLGFKGDEIVDLADMVYSNFPNMKYNFNGNVQAVKFKALNPEIFYENNKLI